MIPFQFWVLNPRPCVCYASTLLWQGSVFSFPLLSVSLFSLLLFPEFRAFLLLSVGLGYTVRQEPPQALSPRRALPTHFSPTASLPALSCSGLVGLCCPLGIRLENNLIYQSCNLLNLYSCFHFNTKESQYQILTFNPNNPNIGTEDVGSAPTEL